MANLFSQRRYAKNWSHWWAGRQRSSVWRAIISGRWMAMPDRSDISSPQVGQPGNTPRTEYRPSREWTPIYPRYLTSHPRAGERIPHALPIDWQCPCGAILAGSKACPHCGRIPRDTAAGKLDGSQRCTTGEQGREWKKIGRGRF